MRKENIILALMVGVSAVYAQTDSLKKSIHQFVVNDIDGKQFDFSSLKGKKVLVVNTC